MAVINRRELFQAGAAVLAAETLSKIGFAQNPAEAAPAMAPPAKPLRIDAYSRTLQWLRTPQEVAEACHQIGNTTIDLTVRTYPGHVDPAKVKTDLPIFVKGLEQNGITMTVLGADITDADTPYLEDMLGTASSLGVRYSWWRGFRFDDTKLYPPQIEELKPRLEKLVKIQEKYGIKAMYHPQGGPVFDYLELVRNFDPRYVGLHYDTSHWLQVSQSNMQAMILLASPYVAGFVWKDAVVEKQSPEEEAAAAAARATAAAARTAAAGSRPAGGAEAGAGRGPGGGAAEAGGGRGAGGGAGGGRGAGGGPGGGPGGGRGGPGGGRGVAYNGWGTRQVPVGSGMVDFTVAARALKIINFDGPTECQPEWSGLGGAENGRDTLTLPRETVIALLKHDYDTIHKCLVTADEA